VDWRKVDDVLTPVKNQGQCGSCWAFSTTEQVESQFYLAGGPPVVLSAQQVTSCAKYIDDPEEGCCFGCGGGDVTVAYDYIKGAIGLSPAAYWPYTQALTPDEECLGPFCTNACDMDLSELDLGELAKTIQATPAAVCVNAGAWDDYTGGVLRYDACSGAYADIDHCVQLVGYDATGEEPYWIVRNSWSTSWGEDGYIRLQMDANTCGV
ncbi:hypothetical protein AURANDRAFT_5846, partial [Aureococcus anophagefferens]